MTARVRPADDGAVVTLPVEIALDGRHSRRGHVHVVLMLGPDLVAHFTARKADR